MSLRLGDLEFDRVRYDADADVLYLGAGSSEQGAWTDSTPEGHAVSFDAAGRVTGLTVVNARWLTERDGKLTVMLPHVVEADAGDLAAALAS